MRKMVTASGFPYPRAAEARWRVLPGPAAILAGLAAMLAGGLAWADGPAAGATGIGTDLAGDSRCLGCHADVGTAWEHPSSHSVLLDCATCHKVTGASGKGHAQTPACGQCHSQKSHPTDAAACATCHVAHGSANAFLVRETLQVPSGATVAVKVARPEGTSKDGLARAGVTGEAAGTGVCEVCHAGTSVYNAAGTGAAHSTRWCGECHRHEAGYASPGATP